MADTRINAALAAQPAHLVKLCCALIDAGQGDKAVALVDQALALKPGDPHFREAAAIILTHRVPKFHSNMLEDSARNHAYARAIARAVAGGDKVLDIGAGTGLLAMMAARAGASEVIACEANPMLAATARAIVADNGLADTVRIFAKNSADIDVEADLDGRVDVIVHEIFGHDLVGESVLPALRDAVRRFAYPDTRIVPPRASARIALADLAGDRIPPLRIVAGFDLGLFDRHVAAVSRIEVDDPRLHLRSEAHDIFAFDFTSPDTPATASATIAACSTGGRVNGVAQWIRIEFDGDEAIENRPGTGSASHWQAVFFPLAEAIDTTPGDTLSLHAWHDQLHLRVWAATAP